LVVLNAIVQIRLATGYPDLFSSEVGAELWAWVRAVGGIAYTTFLVALGSYVLLWLRVRQALAPTLDGDEFAPASLGNRY
jgi:hypothetical protein